MKAREIGMKYIFSITGNHVFIVMDGPRLHVDDYTQICDNLRHGFKMLAIGDMVKTESRELRVPFTTDLTVDKQKAIRDMAFEAILTVDKKGIISFGGIGGGDVMILPPKEAKTEVSEPSKSASSEVYADEDPGEDQTKADGWRLFACDVHFVTTPQVVACLETLLESGLWGRSVGEVAERLVCEGLQDKDKFK